LITAFMKAEDALIDAKRLSIVFESAFRCDAPRGKPRGNSAESLMDHASSGALFLFEKQDPARRL